MGKHNKGRYTKLYYWMIIIGGGMGDNRQDKARHDECLFVLFSSLYILNI